VRPDVVHFHNLHNLGAALIDEAATRGLPSYFSTHNYWLICPRAYLLTGAGAICGGPGDRGRDCASCVGAPHDTDGHQQRLEGIRDRFTRGSRCASPSPTRCAPPSPAGLPGRHDRCRPAGRPRRRRGLGAPGRDRRPGRSGERLTVAFFGSAYPHKGPQLLIEAAQRTGQNCAS
jgi:glycosyltransferase involved in cell wall biosynthesis